MSFFFCGLLLILSPHKVAKVFALPQLFSTPRHKAKWLWLWLWRLRPELLERLERLGRRGGTCGNHFGQGTSKGGPTQINGTFLLRKSDSLTISHHQT
jgi:hypothetical protein